MDVQNFVTNVLAEFKSRSGIFVNTDKSRFIQMAGWQAMFAPGCYQLPKNMEEFSRPESLHYVIENAPGKELEVLFHEIAHASAIRLNRSIDNFHGSMEYDLEEVIAETAAKKLINHFKMMTPEIKNNLELYISQYAQGISSQAYATVDEKANEAMSFILANWLPDINTAFLTLQERAA